MFSYGGWFSPPPFQPQNYVYILLVYLCTRVTSDVGSCAVSRINEHGAKVKTLVDCHAQWIGGLLDSEANMSAQNVDGHRYSVLP